ncbi:hypothetical protein ABEB36_003767 [Hypothenemus hampei]|uniref:Trissin n=1 Tax=Hypothenemus hampei TaxID=57062 RepID=A0ABD1F124_HYPHA
MNKELLVTVIILGVVWGEAETCNFCGSECQLACGTRHFRSCCFNYLKKRNNPEPLTASLDPILRLELWFARSKYPYFQSGFMVESLIDVLDDPDDINGQHQSI